MKPYTQFVNDVFECVISSFDDPTRALVRFAEKDICKDCMTSQEYAVLCDDNARLFYSVFCKNARFFGVKMSDRKLQISKEIHPDVNKIYYDVKIVHSCYPKNLRRWLNGTISRKKLNRVDFCVLTFCHIIDWDENFMGKTPDMYKPYQKRMVEICDKYAGKNDKILSIEILWKAATEAYQRSYEK